MNKVAVAGNQMLGFRVVEDATGQPAMTGRSPADNGGGKMDEAAFQGI